MSYEQKWIFSEKIRAWVNKENKKEFLTAKTIDEVFGFDNLFHGKPWKRDKQMDEIYKKLKDKNAITR